MDQTIRVSGEKESEVRVRLAEVENQLKAILKRRWGITYPIYKGIFYVVFNERNKLGEFDPNQNIILLSEDLIYLDFSVLRNVFLHEAAHALDFALNGNQYGGHTPVFREYCSLLGVQDGFEKAKVKKNIDKNEEVKKRIEKLMALSTSPFENEAMVALSKARKLLAENTTTINNDTKEDKIYYVTLYGSGRIPFYISRLSSFVGKATGVFIIKVMDRSENQIRAYGSLDEVEASLYLFRSLISQLDKEVMKLRKKGHKITKDSFVEGACPEMEKKLRSEDSSADNALIIIQNENRDKAERLCFKSHRFTKRYSHSHVDSKSLTLGREFGRSVDINSSMGRKEIDS